MARLISVLTATDTNATELNKWIECHRLSKVLFFFFLLGACVASENEASWYVEPCECTEGWTGDLCDEDIDGCAENPCFSFCTDVVASKVM